MQFAVLIAVTCIATIQATDHETWNYSDLEAWKHVEGWSCDGMRQSPININTSLLREDSRLINLVLTNFNRPFEGNWSNTGHSVQFNPSSNESVRTIMTHVGLYKFLQFHFHWGGNRGSEHTVDGNKFSGEMHFVTRKSTANMTAGDAFAVLGVFLMEDPSVPSESTTWMELLNKIPHEAREQETVKEVTLSDFVPNDMSYYYYEGSLTTPPCSQVVQWFVLKTPMRVPQVFMNGLRTMVNDERNEVVIMNFRDTQLLNNRNVMVHNDDMVPNTDGSGSAIDLASFGIMLLTGISVLVCGISY